MQGELARFHQFIAERLHAGGQELSPEEALDLWRLEHPRNDIEEEDDDEEDVDDAAAIMQALEDMRAGDTGMSREEFERRIRQRHSL